MVRINDLFRDIPDCLAPLFCGREYPWEVFRAFREYVDLLIEKGIPGFEEYSPGVLIGEGVRISDGVSITPPAIIGRNTELRPGAYLRGYVVCGEGCVIGNSTEVKNAILFDRVQIPHYNYVGDSILGCGSHLGAGSVCSNLKNDGTSVVVHADKDYETGLRKLGAILADGANVGCGCVLNPGTVIGRGSAVYPLLSVRGCVPEDSIMKSVGNIVKKQK